jgi:ubiquinone/menaquinone biosynthesis C-methylase UbiE
LRAQKNYNPSAWQERVAVELLQRNYDDQGWKGPLGEYRRRSVDRLAVRLREIFDQKREPVTLLDVACFSGEYFGSLMEEEKMETILSYTGIDVTPKFVRHAAERWKDFPNAQFKIGSALQLDFPVNSFDIVFNSGMLIHVADPQTCISEFARTAKRFLMVETTTNPTLKVDFIDENKSGDNFIDRVYRPQFIENLITKVAGIVKKTEVPYTHNVSSLYECTPR